MKYPFIRRDTHFTKHELQRTVLDNKEFISYAADYSAMKMTRTLLFAEDHIVYNRVCYL